MRAMIFLVVLCSLLLSCGKNSPEPANPPLTNPTSTEVKYVLPYPVGKAYTCSQGFNTSFSHYESFSYSVDFDMPIGTIVTAARSGRVVYVVESYSDNDRVAGHENVVIVMHDDSTYARYVHLTINGALVELEQLLAPGDTVGLSGTTGNSNHPHLHFDVTGTFAGRSDQTIPFDFKNTSPHPPGLERGVVYEALPY